MNTSTLVNSTRQYNALTANGAVTHSTSLSSCLDLFFLAGASRRMSDEDIICAFERARAEDKNLAYKILFWARDARGGAGEKRFFQVIARYCFVNHREEWDIVAIFVEKYGYWKDLFVIETPCEDNLNYFKHQLEENPNANLLAKWFPRKGEWFVAMHKYLKMTPKEFRKYLVSMSETVENAMCTGDWDKINYSKVPSVAMNTYRTAFCKHDLERFNAFNESVLEGEEKVNASVLFPHMLYDAIENGEDRTAVEAQWQSLPNYMEGSTQRILPVCDVSGSMWGLPMSVSVALGLYIAERNEGAFKDAFMTFSETPEMLLVKGDSLAERMNSIQTSKWGYNTNLLATFELILNSAVRDNIPVDEMPTKLLIISDMEFDQACSVQNRYTHDSNLDSIRYKYADAGYPMPGIIFWNVNGRLGNVPATSTDSNTGLVSGFSPAILTAILAGEEFTPYSLMLQAVNSERYSCITVEVKGIIDILNLGE